MIGFSSPMRRDVLQAGAVAGAVAALPALAAGEPPPETKRIRMPRYPVDIACISPMWIAEELLRAEGFEDVVYVPTPMEALDSPWSEFTQIEAGSTDMTITDIFAILPALDAGKQAVALAGIHGGCYELFAEKSLRSIRDLKGKTHRCRQLRAARLCLSNARTCRA
ncbi:MAG: hypothetical protein ABL900_03330 [Burkholderiaceae bacterium]